MRKIWVTGTPCSIKASTSLIYQEGHDPGLQLLIMGSFNPKDTFDSREYKVMDATIRDWNVNMGISEGETPDLCSRIYLFQ